MIKKSKCVCKCHFQRHPQSETITDATDMKTVASHLHRTKSWRHPGPWSWRLTKAGKRRVCNNFRHRFFVFINSSACYSNAPRMGTEGTGPQTVQENGPVESGLFPTVLRRKNKNLGLFKWKVPRFCPKSTDVLPQEVRCFYVIILLFSPIFRTFTDKIPGFSPQKFQLTYIHYGHLQQKPPSNWCFSAKDFVKIFEGN